MVGERPDPVVMPSCPSRRVGRRAVPSGAGPMARAVQAHGEPGADGMTMPADGDSCTVSRAAGRAAGMAACRKPSVRNHPPSCHLQTAPPWIQAAASAPPAFRATRRRTPTRFSQTGRASRISASRSGFCAPAKAPPAMATACRPAGSSRRQAPGRNTVAVPASVGATTILNLRRRDRPDVEDRGGRPGPPRPPASSYVPRAACV